MKRTTNEIQRRYMAAKALVDTLDEQRISMEQDYIAAHGIINPDGTIPERIYCIDDESVFDAANESCSEQIQSCGLEKQYNDARDLLFSAENEMIEYGLSLAPSSVRVTLEKGARNNYTTRQKIIELVLRLDTSTVEGTK